MTALAFPATYGDCSAAMAAPTLAWGKVHLFSLPDDSHLYGRELELSPAGTMFAAGVILHGIIGAPATIGKDNIARIADDAELVIYPVRGTEPAELELHSNEITEGFRLKELQDAQG